MSDPTPPGWPTSEPDSELEIQELYREAQQLGRAAERAAIVAWLRGQAETADGWIPDLVRVADCIDRGDHTQPELATREGEG